VKNRIGGGFITPIAITPRGTVLSGAPAGPAALR
jgi:hypothetical protein